MCHSAEFVILIGFILTIKNKNKNIGLIVAGSDSLNDA